VREGREVCVWDIDGKARREKQLLELRRKCMDTIEIDLRESGLGGMK
jgi:hypothetical protein